MRSWCTVDGQIGSTDERPYIYSVINQVQPLSTDIAAQPFIINNQSLPPNLENVKGFLRKVLIHIGAVSVADASEFRDHGIRSTQLRSPAFKDISFLGRNETIHNIFNTLNRECRILSKLPLLTIPAGPGYGKSEFASRMIENLDQYISEHNTMIATASPLKSDTWLACGITFNYQTTHLVGFDQNFVDPLEKSSTHFELLIGFRLFYIWLIDKSICSSYNAFCETLSDMIKYLPKEETARWKENFRLKNVVSLIQQLSKRPKTLLFLDESLLPFRMYPEAHYSFIISNIAHLQDKNLVIIFTNLRQSPFQHYVWMNTLSNILLRFPMYRLNHNDSCTLIKEMAAIIAVTRETSNCWSKCQENILFYDNLVDVLAWWSGGRPRFCEYAAIIITGSPTSLVNEMMKNIYNLFTTKNDESYFLKIPRESVVMALLGVKLKPHIDVICSISQGKENDTFDSLISRGLLSREKDNQLYQSPLLLQLYCNQKDPPLSIEESIKSANPDYKGLGRRRVSDPSFILAQEIRSLMDCLSPSSDGKQLENFDRQKFRLLRVVRNQFINDVSNEQVLITKKNGDIVLKTVRACSVENGIVVGDLRFDRQSVDWRSATLEDYFGEFKFNTITDELKAAKYDVFTPFLEKDKSFDKIPQYSCEPETVAYLTSRQFYPINKESAGFDWFCVLVDSTGNLVVVATENKFSGSLLGSSNKIDATKDILKKLKRTLKRFMDAGWSEDRIIFRLAAHRYLPDIDAATIRKFKKNLIVCGPEELRNSYSSSVLDMFFLVSAIDKTK